MPSCCNILVQKEMPAERVSATAIQTLEWAHFLAGTWGSQRWCSQPARGKGQRQEGTVPAGLAHGPTSDVGRVDSFMDSVILPEPTLATSFAWNAEKIVVLASSVYYKTVRYFLVPELRGQLTMMGTSFKKTFWATFLPSADPGNGSNSTRVVSSIPSLLNCNSRKLLKSDDQQQLHSEKNWRKQKWSP